MRTFKVLITIHPSDYVSALILLPDCYDDWILPERERLRQSYFRALERLIQLLERQRKYGRAIRYAQRLLRHDPLHEAAYRGLMRLHALKGDRAGALRVYRTCATALQRELGVEPMPATRRVYEQLLAAEAGPLLPNTVAPGLPALVGREQEWAQLWTIWREAVAGGPRLILLQGEAGTGKTRLAEELMIWADRQGLAHASACCFAAEGRLAYGPVIAWLRARPLPLLDDAWLRQISRFLPEVRAERPDLPRPGPLTDAWQRQRLFEALARAILGYNQPLLLFLDDLQWCDRDTTEWLHYLVRFDPRAQLLIVGAFRPEEIDEEHPLLSLQQALRPDQVLAEIEVRPLDKAQTAVLAANLSGHTPGPAQADHLYRETEGNPLFIVEEEVQRLFSFFHEQRYNVYLRDVSFLGFPSVLCYVPEVSALGRKNVPQPALSQTPIMFELDRIESQALKIKSCSNTVLEEIAGVLGKLGGRPAFTDVFGIKLEETSPWTEYPVALLLCQIWYRLGHIDKSNEAFKQFMQIREGDENPYYELVALYLERRANGLSEKEAAQDLTEDPAHVDLARMVVKDLADPSGLFSFVKLPNCPDCEKCELQTDCVTMGRLTVMKGLLSAMMSRHIEQEELNWVT